ncbi:MAG: AmmeMemoRadiSam system protein B [Kiritimatiellaeota bacterium]|nr:AmmeMemoRadiSam system protein B [Kiritimatiellota bacterium]
MCVRNAFLRTAGALLLSGCVGAKAPSNVHLPAVQGQFYPSDKAELTRVVDGFLARPPAVRVKGRVRALISPHAGYIYSGAVAGEGFQQVPQGITRVIVMGPSHHVAIRGGGSIPDVKVYRNALGDVLIDPAAAELRRKYEFFGCVPAAHKREHSVEVMLPFLQRHLKKPFTFIPIVLGVQFDAEAVARALLPLVRDPRTLIVASSDLSHYKPYDKAKELDSDCLDTILRLDIEELQAKQLCGKAPVTVLLYLARLAHWKPILIDYKNSGDTAGSKARVVGYGCVAFTEEEKMKPLSAPIGPPGTNKAGAPVRSPTPARDPEAARALLTPLEQKQLLALARTSIEASLAGRDLPSLPESESGIFSKKHGCFVTLHERGQLRGCIGNIFPVHPLAEAVQKNALSAAFRDPRFNRVRPGEMKDIDIEISVLTLPRELTYKDGEDLKRQLRPGRHGVVISQGIFRRSTYLPQVWEQLPDKDEFLSRLCLKGGMDKSAWKDPKKTTVEVYEAFVFGEEK